MAIIANTFQTFQSIGNREQLANAIYQISPEETPFMSNIGRGKCSSVLFEWQTDALASASGSNKQIQGDDISSYDAAVPTVRLQNYTQIARKTAVVADTLEFIDRAGRKSEMAYQLAKKSAELKRDIEKGLTSNQIALAGNTSTASTTASILAFIKTNVDKASDGTNPSYTTLPNALRVDGTARAFSEAQLKNVHQLAWAEGGDPKMVMLGGVNKQNMSAFTGIAQIRKAVEGAKAATIIAAADVYVGDFGKLSVVPNRFMRTSDALVLDPSLIKLAFLRPFKTKPLAVTGDAEKRLIIVEYGLQVNNEKGLALVTDLTAVLN